MGKVSVEELFAKAAECMKKNKVHWVEEQTCKGFTLAKIENEQQAYLPCTSTDLEYLAFTPFPIGDGRMFLENSKRC